MKKQTVCMFSFRGEEEIILMSVGTMRKSMPYANVHVFDDGNDPLTPETVESLTASAGVHYHVTHFDRGKNLNGKDAVCGILDCMVKAAELDGNDDGVVIKTDPDTLFLRPGEYLDMMMDGKKWMTHCTKKGFFSGMFYAMSVEALYEVRKNAHAIEMPDEANEDTVIGCLCYLSTHTDQSAIHWVNASNPKDNHRFAAFDVSRMDDVEYIRGCAEKAHILTVGNTGVAGLPRAYRVKIMRDVLEAFDRSNRTATATVTAGTGTNDNDKIRKTDDHGNV